MELIPVCRDLAPRFVQGIPAVSRAVLRPKPALQCSIRRIGLPDVGLGRSGGSSMSFLSAPKGGAWRGSKKACKADNVLGLHWNS
jgi:hypothetical protein